MKPDYARYLLKKTGEDYNLLAEEFDRTRYYIPDDIKSLAGLAKLGDRVLDLGCGNGRLAELFHGKKIQYHGVDVSERLVKIAKSKHPNDDFLIMDSLSIPFPDSYFNVVFALAVVHHVPSREFRSEFLSEIKRTLKPGGRAIITSWNLFYKRSVFADVVKNCLKRIIGLTRLDCGDVMYRFKNSQGQVITYRYLHSFTKKSLRLLCRRSGLRVIESGNLARGSHRNVYVVAEKGDYD